MKKLLLLFMVLLVACSSETSGTEENKEESTFKTATTGDTVTDDYGTYTIKKVITPESTHETGPIVFELQKVLLAKFVPHEDGMIEENLNLAIALIESENTSDDTVSFHPFSTKVTTDTKGQYKAQIYLNEGDSEHIGKVIQEFRIPFNLEDESLSELKELNFRFDAPSKDSRSIGEDVTVTVPIK